MNEDLKFFDFEKFENYLRGIVRNRLTTKHHKKSINIFSEPLTESSFQLIDREILGNHSFTSGYYRSKKSQVLGYREEFIFRVKNPSVFKESSVIPKGKYRIKVYGEVGDKKPSVKIFATGLFGWKEKPLPKNLPLTEILKNSLENYVINSH